jgi:hypothetical protein
MTDSEIFSGVVDLLKTLAWPAVVLWGVLYWRDEIRAAAKRITEIGPTGAKFAAPAEQQVPTLPSDVAGQTVGKENNKSFPEVPTLPSDVAGQTVGKENNQSLPDKRPDVQAFIGQIKSVVSEDRGGPVFRNRMAAWLRWILGWIMPPICPRLLA